MAHADQKINKSNIENHPFLHSSFDASLIDAEKPSYFGLRIANRVFNSQSHRIIESTNTCSRVQLIRVWFPTSQARGSPYDCSHARVNDKTTTKYCTLLWTSQFSELLFGLRPPLEESASSSVVVLSPFILSFNYKPTPEPEGRVLHHWKFRRSFYF